MSSSLVSVIIPVYNVEQYIRKSIESVINQSYKNLEIIIVDDGSTDESGLIADSYAEIDKRVMVIHKVNGGQGSARNKALDICRGEYITFLDSDDCMDKYCVERLLDIMFKTKSEIAVSNYCFMNKEGDFLAAYGERKNRKRMYEFDGIEATRIMMYQTLFDVQPWGKMYKKELWNEVRFDESRCSEDLATTYKVVLKANKVVYIGEPLINYLVRDDSSVHKAFVPEKMEMINIVNEIYLYAIEENIDIQDSVVCRLVSVSLMLAIELINEKQHHSIDYLNCEQIIKRYRHRLLGDNQIRKKTRIALILSYLGMNRMALAYSFSKKCKMI